MSTLRLNAISITGLPQVSKTKTASLPYTARVNCVLHSGPLPAHQQLEVRVNDILQTGRLEEGQTVFSWQLFKATDAVHITLLNRGIRTRQWQGCWNERDAILHTGTLNVHIIFDGKTQPVMETTMTISSPLTETINGTNGHRGTNPSEKDEETKDATVIVQELLIIAEAQQILQLPLEMETSSAEDQRAREEDEDELDDREKEAYEPEGDEDECEEDQEESEHPEDEEIRDHFQGREDTAIEEEQADAVVGDEQSGRTASTQRTRRCIAAFYANPLMTEETLQSLKDLVAVLPTKILIVDLRVQSQRQEKKHQEHNGFSKRLLRAVFGTTYWDRGWAVQTAYEHIPSDRQGKTTRGRFMVINPDHHPDGIPSLVQRMMEGYSIVVMDSQASYEESRRQAVIEEVRKRISDLDVGPLS